MGESFGAIYSGAEDRSVRGAVSGTRQRSMGFSDASATGGITSMVNADTHRFITYTPRPANILEDTRTTNDIQEIRDLHNRTGTVDMQSYMSWLREHGYVFAGPGEW